MTSSCQEYQLFSFSFEADNSDLVCIDACKDTIYILASNHGIKSPEEFSTLVCRHFLSKYSHITIVCLTMEDFSWNRIAYDAEADGDEKLKLHNHAFIHAPECLRTCSVTMNRNGLKVFYGGKFNLSLKLFSTSLDMAPQIESGIKHLRLAKTSQATFVGFYRDEYTTLQNNYERVLRLALEALQQT